ncbi:hypothetical protein [Rhizobium binxianense]
MASIVLNSAVAILIASAFLMTAVAALRNAERSMQKVPVKVKARQHPTG